MPESKTLHQNSPREVKRERILRAAIDVFAQQGYFSARMTDVAKAAKVADGTLYLYFEGKEHLLISVFDDVLSRFIDRLRHDISDAEDPIDKLRIMVGLHLETLAHDRALAHVLQIETRHSQRFMSLLTRGRLGEYLDFLRAIIEEGQEVGAFRQDIGPGLMTNFVFGAVDELLNSWLLADQPGDLMRFHTPLMDLISHGMADRSPPGQKAR